MSTHRIAGRLVEELVSADLDRALTAQEEGALTEHLRGCAACQRMRARYERQHQQLRAWSSASSLARDREAIWAGIASRRARPRPRWPPFVGAVTFAAVVLLAAVLVGVVLGERVAAPGPVREVVASTTFDLPAGGVATLTIEQGTALARPGEHTGVAARAEIRLPAPATRGSAEVRFRREGEVSYGVLGSAPDLSGSNRSSFGGAFPRPDGTGAVTYHIWLHLETDTGTIDGTAIVVDVTATRRGEVARAH